MNTIQREVGIMRQVIESCRSITSLIPRREKLRELHAEVEARHADPSRLLNKRGGRSLLEEQKMEARVKRELPSLEKQMIALIAEWEAKYGRDFVYNGKRYADVIVHDQEEDLRAIEDRKQKIAERKMRDLDQSTYVSSGPSKNQHNVTVVQDRSIITAAPKQTQSAKVATKTMSRTAPTPAPAAATAAPHISQEERAQTMLTTPTNVPARKHPTSVSISRATPHTVTGASGVGRAVVEMEPSTTPVSTVGGKKYSKVKSKVDTHRTGPTTKENKSKPLSAIHNTPPKSKGGFAL